MHDDEILTTKGAAQFLKVSVSTLKRWCNDPDKAEIINPSKLSNRTVRFQKKNLLAFIEWKSANGPDPAVMFASASALRDFFREPRHRRTVNIPPKRQRRNAKNRSKPSPGSSASEPKDE